MRALKCSQRGPWILLKFTLLIQTPADPDLISSVMILRMLNLCYKVAMFQRVLIRLALQSCDFVLRLLALRFKVAISQLATLLSF